MSVTSTAPRPSLFANRNFSLLFGGSSVSALGDQFTLVALPWLVLKLTGDPAALGLVLAVMAFPRAAFMLVGGAVADRLSPRRVLLGARTANAVCIVFLAVLVLGGHIQMWMVYVLALGIGLSTAFAYPAGSAMMPQVLPSAQLRTGNALFMGMRQLSLVLGPVLAGFVIAQGAAHDGTPHALQDAHGMGLAFSIDAASFVASLVSLILIRLNDEVHPAARADGVLASVVAGLRAVWADRALRAFMLYVAMVSVFVGGPVQVGLPLLADQRLNLGAASLGILMTSNGVGMFVGSLLSGLAARVSRGRLGLMVLCFDGVVGVVFAALALVHTTFTGAVLLVGIGVLEGILQISIFTWIQQRVPQHLLGRTMSVLMFAFMGLGPLSAALAGGLLKVIPLPALFMIAGLSLTVIALACLASRDMRSIRAASPATSHP